MSPKGPQRGRSKYRLPPLAVVHHEDGFARSLSEKAYIVMRDRIISLELNPGAPLDDAELMKDLQVGRTPIRDAWKRLAQEKLVTIIPHRGTLVSEISITDLPQICELRIQLEGQAARLTAERATSKERSVIVDLARQLAELGEDSDESELIRRDARIHRQIHRATRNPFLIETLEQHLYLSLRLWFALLPQLVKLKSGTHHHPAVDEHQEIAEAIMARDGKRAEQEMQRHIARFQEDIRRTL